MIDLNALPTSEVNGLVYRVILSRYPQIHLFERISTPEDWEVLYAVESLTNPRLRDEVGDIRLVASADRVYGDGAAWIMAAFTHPPVDGRGGRFNHDLGIYYCSADESVAIAESSFHRTRFLRESRIEKTTQEMRVIRYLKEGAIYDSDNYDESQQAGYAIKTTKSFGVHYESVRCVDEWFGVMRPKVLSDAIHWRYLRYHFNQGEIADVEPLNGSVRGVNDHVQ